MGKQLMKTKIALVSVALVSMLVPALSQAAWVTYPGILCRYYDPQGYDYYFDPGGHKANGLQNDDNSAKHVSCPVLWDYAEDLNLFIYIRSSEADCDAYSVEHFSNFSSGEWQSVPMDSDMNQDGVWRYRNDTAISFGSMTSIYCNIPSGAVVNGYIANTLD